MENKKLPRIKPTVCLLTLSLFSAILFLILGFYHSGQVLSGSLNDSHSIQASYGKLPLSFIRNDGQVDQKVEFYERGSGHAVFFSEGGIYLSLVNSPRPAADLQKPAVSDRQDASESKQAFIKLIPLGANKHPKIVSEGLQEGKVNYLVGNDPKKWKTNISTYQAVVYQEIYPGIDLKFYGNNRQMEYDIIVKPDADVSLVKLAYEGIKDIRITESGDLEIGLNNGKVIQKKPVIYQQIDGKRVDLVGRFKLFPGTDHEQKHAYGFEVVSYDKAYPLIIDPALVYSTYLGGSGPDIGTGITTDPFGNSYITGTTSSPDFPVTDSLQATNNGGSGDVFITKINPDGSALIYSTYLGGHGFDAGQGIAVDPSGNVYVTGETVSYDFPVVNPLQRFYGGDGYDAFVVKLNPTGSALIYSTYLGGNGYDTGYSIAADSNGNAYVTGSTNSSDFPTLRAIQATFGGGSHFGGGNNDDVFVAKIKPAGAAFVYSTYLGSEGPDRGYGIAADDAGNAYLTGFASSNFPTTPGAYQTTAGGSPAFVTKINPSGSSFVFSSYIKEIAVGTGVAVDGLGNSYVIGNNNPGVPLIAGAFLIGTGGGSDVLLVKLNAAGSAPVYATYIGGSNADSGQAIAVDTVGNAYLTGVTASSDFPTASPVQPSWGGYDDAFVAKLNPIGSALVYSTYLGGNDEDQGTSIAVDNSGNAYVVGLTKSLNFPTANPLQPTFAGGQGGFDPFVAKISPETTVSTTTTIAATTTSTTTTTLTPTSTTTTTTIPCTSGGVVVDPNNTVSILLPGVATTIPVAINSTKGQFDIFLSDGGVGGTIVCPATGCSGGINLTQVGSVTVNFTYTAPADAPDLITLVASLARRPTCGYGVTTGRKTFVTNSSVTTTTTTTIMQPTTTTTISTTTTTTAANQSLSAVSLAPVNITTAPGSAQTFTAGYSDSNGYMDISTATLTFWQTSFGLQVVYHPSSNEFTMAGADGSCAPGQAAVLTDGFLTLNCGASTISGSGNNLTVAFNVTPQPPSSGMPYQAVISVQDQAGASDSKMPGTWIVNRRPSADSVSPMNSMIDPGMGQMFTVVYSDPDGWQNIAAANFYLSGNGGMHNEWLHYLVAPNLFTMMGTNDSCNPGQMKMLSNGYLTLDCSSSSISGSGNVLTVIFQVTPQMTSSGIMYDIFTAASDQAAAAYAIFAGTWQIQ